MEPTEYDAMHVQEQSFWWYRALHSITLARLKQLNLPSQAHILDAGCGTGGLLKRMRQEFPNSQFTGLEYNPVGIQYLQQLQSHKISIINGNINTPPFADNTFDVIVLNDVLYHQNIQSQACLSECLRILKPQGHLLINVAAYNWMYSTHDKQVHTRERYTVTKLKQQLEQANFAIHKTNYWNSLLFPLMALHRLTAGKTKQDSYAEALAPWQDKLLYRIIHCEEFLQQHCVFIPFGGSTWAWASKP